MSKYQLAKHIGYIRYILGAFRGNVASIKRNVKNQTRLLKHVSGNQYFNKGAVAISPPKMSSESYTFSGLQSLLVDEDSDIRGSFPCIGLLPKKKGSKKITELKYS